MKVNFPILAFLSVVLASCSPNYYLPTRQHVMLFEKKGDIIVGGNLGLGHKQIGVEAGYAFSDNIGVYSSFNSFNISQYGNSSYLIKDFIWDNELIVYKKFDFGLYTGVNFGAGLGKLNAGNPYYDLGLNRQFIQPTLGFKYSYFDLAVSTRLTRLSYNLKPLIVGMTDYDYYMFNNYFDFSDIVSEHHFFVEPALTFGVSSDVFKFNVQYSLATKSGKDAYFYIKENFTTSISFNIDKLFFHRANKTNKLRWTY